MSSPWTISITSQNQRHLTHPTFEPLFLIVTTRTLEPNRIPIPWSKAHSTLLHHTSISLSIVTVTQHNPFPADHLTAKHNPWPWPWKAAVLWNQYPDVAGERANCNPIFTPSNVIPPFPQRLWWAPQAFQSQPFPTLPTVPCSFTGEAQRRLMSGASCSNSYALSCPSISLEITKMPRLL